jgi:HD-GYP domain-containing protein (c-di-GMP phosphodiesterase class II)
MHLVSVDHVQPGAILGRSLYNERMDLMLATGYKLTRDILISLKNKGFTYIYVMDQVADDIIPEEVINTTLRQAATKSVGDAFNTVRSSPVFKSIRPNELAKRLDSDPKLSGLLNLNSMRTVAVNLIEEVIANNVKMFSELPIRSDDGYEMQHAIDVSLLSLLVGQQLGMVMNDLRSLVTASLLHDIGKSVIDSYLKSLKEHTAADIEAIEQEHPTYSMLLIKGSDSSSFKEQFTAQQHHELLNGEGYPSGLTADDVPPLKKTTAEDGKQIFRFAQILAVTNRYDNLVSGVIDGTIMSPEKALESLVLEAGDKWNSFVVRALVQVVQLYPIGTRVRVVQTDTPDIAGYYGVVIENVPEYPSKPVVILTHNSLQQQITPMKFDFKLDRRIKLELVL